MIAIIIGGCALIFWFGMLCWRKTSREYFLNNYSSLAWAALVTILATLIGVFLAFQVDNYKQEQIEKDIFKHKLIAMILETSQNIRNIKDIRSGFTEKGVNIKQLNSQVAEQVLSDPLTFKYGGQGLFFATSVMVDTIDSFNNYSEFVIEQFKRTKENSDENLKPIYESLDQAEYRIRIIQKVLDFYNVEKFRTTLWKEPNYNEIWRMISGKIDFKEELKKLKQEETESQEDENSNRKR